MTLAGLLGFLCLLLMLVPIWNLLTLSSQSGPPDLAASWISLWSQPHPPRGLSLHLCPALLSVGDVPQRWPPSTAAHSLESQWHGQVLGRWHLSSLLFRLLSPSPLLPQPELAEPCWSILHTSVVLTLPTDGSCCASLTSPVPGSAPVNYAPITTPSLSFGPSWPDSLAVPSPCPWPPPASIALPAPLLTLLVLCPLNTVVFWKSRKFKSVFHLLSIFVLATLWEFLTPSSEYLFLSFNVLNQVVVIHKWNSFSRQIYDLASTPASFLGFNFCSENSHSLAIGQVGWPVSPPQEQTKMWNFQKSIINKEKFSVL